jgi:hypothetical protein
MISENTSKPSKIVIANSHHRSCKMSAVVASEEPKRNLLAAPEKHGRHLLLKTMLDGGASSFGKAFVLYALPMSIIRRELKKSVLKRASAIAAFMGITKAVQIYLFQQKSQFLRYYSQAIAGGVGACVALGIDRNLGYNTMVIWFTIRAVRCLLEENVLGRWIYTSPHLPTIVMCLSAAQILSTWVRYPAELDPAYRRFLDTHGGRPKWVMKRFAAPNIAAIFPLYMMRKPNTGMLSDGFQFFLAGFRRASKVYAPLFLASFVVSLFQPKNHTSLRLVKLLKNLVVNVIQSSVFLSAYCTFAWLSWPVVCLMGRTYYNGATRVGLRRHVWMAGLATLFERKERRPELASYCATYAIDTIWRRLEIRYPYICGLIQPFLSAILLIASCSIMLHHYNKQPALVTKWVLGFTTDDQPRKQLPADGQNQPVGRQEEVRSQQPEQ